MDMENIELGWIMFAANSAPQHLLVKWGTPLPAKPADGKWKQGLRVMMKLDKNCGGDIREITSNAQAFLKGFDDFHTKYEVEKVKNPGKLPIVILRTTEPITSGTGSNKSTNYQPVFEIIGWSARPSDLVYVPKAHGPDGDDDGPPWE
jgi:hypothetical protein